MNCLFCVVNILLDVYLLCVSACVCLDESFYADVLSLYLSMKFIEVRTYVSCIYRGTHCYIISLVAISVALLAM